MKGIRSPLQQNGTTNRLFSQTHSSVKTSNPGHKILHVLPTLELYSRNECSEVRLRFRYLVFRFR